jgi:G3E family GTPase
MKTTESNESTELSGSVGTVPTAVPLTILTGFLGAGKTTLLNRLLSGDHGLRMAVLVNDFGAVNVDAELVVGIEDDMMSLANGCVCCQIRDDLMEAVDRVLEADEPPEFIVLEASGVADPASIYSTFNDPQHRDKIRLDSVTCVVDAEQIFEHLDEAPELLMLKTRQIGCADLVILNKVGLVTDEHVAWVRKWIDTVMNRVRILETDYCDIPYDVLLGAGRFSPEAQLESLEAADHDHGEHDHSAPDHGAQFSTWLFETDRPFDSDALATMVKKELPASVLRCKGIIWLADDPDTRHALQVVGRRTEIQSLDGWGSKPRRSQIVAIGPVGAIDGPQLDDAFTRCLAG